MKNVFLSALVAVAAALGIIVWVYCGGSARESSAPVTLEEQEVLAVEPSTIANQGDRDYLEGIEWATYSMPDLGFEIDMPKDWVEAMARPHIGPDPVNEFEFWQDIVGYVFMRHHDVVLEIKVKRSDLSFKEWNHGFDYPIETRGEYEVCHRFDDVVRSVTDNHYGYKDEMTVRNDDIYYTIFFSTQGSPANPRSVSETERFRAIWHVVRDSFRAVPIEKVYVDTKGM